LEKEINFASKRNDRREAQRKSFLEIEIIEEK
jgi:hypothetical protein